MSLLDPSNKFVSIFSRPDTNSNATSTTDFGAIGLEEKTENTLNGIRIYELTAKSNEILKKIYSLF